MGLIPGLNQEKSIKICTYGCYIMRIVCVEEIPWPQTSKIQYHSQLALQNKGRAIFGHVQGAQVLPLVVVRYRNTQ